MIPGIQVRCRRQGTAFRHEIVSRVAGIPFLIFLANGKCFASAAVFLDFHPGRPRSSVCRRASLVPNEQRITSKPVMEHGFGQEAINNAQRTKVKDIQIGRLRLVSTLVVEFIFYRRRFWNKGNFCDACHKRKYGSLPIYSILDGGLVSRTEATMATPITQIQPSPVQTRRSCAFGRLAQLFHIAWNDRALMRFAPTRRMGD